MGACALSVISTATLFRLLNSPYSGSNAVTSVPAISTAVPTYLQKFVEASGTDARGNFHGVGRSRRASGGATSTAPTILPPAGKKSLGPWGSYQVEFDGLSKDPFRRRSHEPMLGPLSYSVPATPQGRGEHTAWDGGAADLAREAAEGWSVPPMPYSDDMVAGTSLSSQYPPGFMMTATGTPILEYPPSLAALIGAHESSQAARAFLPRNGGGVEGKAGPVAPTRARKRGSTDGAPFTHPRAQAPPVCSLLPSTSPPQAYGGRSRGEPGPEAGGGVTPIEGMLQKMADACRQAGVVLDPSLENQLDTVLARQCSLAQLSPTHPPTSAAQTSRASPIPMLPLPPSHPEISRAPSAETASPSSARPVPAALGTRAENPWGWAAEEGGGGPGVSRGAAGGAGGERFNGGSQSVSLPPPRDRLWSVPSPSVPSPYRSLDEKHMAVRCIPEFRLGGGLLHRGKEPSEVVTSVRRETSRTSWKGGKGRRPDISPVTAEPRPGRAESTEALAAAAAVVRGPRDGRDALADIERVMTHRAGGSGAGNMSLSLEGNRRTTVWPQSDSVSFGRDDGAGLREGLGTRQPSGEWGDDGEERRESASVLSSPIGAQDVEAEAEIEVGAESLGTHVEVSYPQDVPAEGPREAEREEGTPCKEIPAFVDVEDDMDEWDDDLDPGYTVLAVSEDEFFQGQYELSSIHDNQEEGLVGEGGRGGRDSDVSQDPLPQQTADRRAFEDTSSLVGECVLSRGGEDDERRQGVEGGASPSAEGVGIEESGRRSWTSASTGAGDLIQFSGGEDSPPGRRATDVIRSPSPPDRGLLVGNTVGAAAAAATQATAANGRGLIRARSEEENPRATAATAAVLTEGVETEERCRGARGSGALRSEPPWQLFGRRIGRRELGGEEGYGDGPAYERDLQEAVTLLENGGFGLDRGEEAGAWRDDSFSESPSSPVDEDRSGGRGANDGEGSNRGRAEADGISSGAGVLAADCRDLNGNDAHHFQTAAVVKTMSLGGGSGGWGSDRARRGVDARESAGPVDRGGYEGGKVAGGGACAASGGPDCPPLRCNHGLVYRDEPAAGSAGPNGRTREGGALGKFDHASSMWPCPARVNFSYNPQGYDGDNTGLLHLGPTAVEGGAGRQNSARSSLDEACYQECGGQASGTHEHPAHAMRASAQQQLEWKELRPPCSAPSSTSAPHPPPPSPSPVDADAAGTSASASASMGTSATATTSTKANPRRDDVLLDFGSDDEDETGETLFTAAGKRVLATATPGTARGKTSGKNMNATLGGVSGRECGTGGATSCVAPAAEATGAGACAGGAAALSPRSRPSDSESGNWDETEFAMGAQEKGGRVSRTSSRSTSFSPLRGGVASARGRGKREAVDPVGEDGALVARRRGGEGEGDEEEEVEEALDELGTFNLRIVFAKGKTGFQESKEFNWPEGSLVADRYEVCGYIGKAAFSTALECRDLRRRRGEDAVCLKVIRNNKDFFDQSLDEIKLLQLIKEGGDPDEHHVLHMLDFFYFEEHLVIVSELLGDNLYEFSKAVKEAGHPEYFTLPRVCKITRQCLEALSYVNSLGLVHCDVKPENILLSNYGKAEVKLVDFGSSCFLTDRLTPYTQSRSYRAPEVILGLPYGAKVDVWSLGAVIAELLTGHVLLQSESVQTMLARIQGIIGPFPRWMLMEGEDAPKYFMPDGHVYQRMVDDTDLGSNEAGSPSLLDGPSMGDRSRSSPSLADESTARLYAIIYPKKTSLKRRLRVNDEVFLDFVSTLLSVDPTRRPLAEEALHHDWIVAGMSYTDEELWYPPDDDRGGAEGEAMDRDGDGDDNDDEPPRVREEPGGHLMMTRRHSS